MKSLLKTLPSVLLILLFVYAAISKMADFGHFRAQLYNQTFPHWLADVLIYSIPLAELTAAGLLVFERTLRFGLGLSLILMALFTAYIALVLMHFWPRVPCSCGGILSHMTWRTHLYFNFFFLLISAVGCYHELSGRRTRR